MPVEKQTEDNKHLWDQFCKLGEMVGDGLHHEPDGKWISKEYRRLSKILIKPDPELQKIFKERRQKKNEIIDKQMADLLENKPCICGGKIKQSRSGSKVAYCESCNKRYKASSKKQKA